ncbi:MAG: iron-containing alcohol dehydrogenase [candidate division Zixibacteria bacterium]|nr:iron-containing alcohol dehydrogenase [candidate division Zixibacteria bacterium]
MFPEHIRFGSGVAGNVGDLIRNRFWVNRVLIVTDVGVAKAGLLAPVLSSFDAADIPFDVCDGVTANPTDDLVEIVAGKYRSDGHDLLVAVGGGSTIDTAKAAQVRITHPGHIRDYFEDGIGAKKIIANMPRLIAIPTTAGTGSEVSAVSVITDTRDGTKKGVYSPFLRPALAAVDPALTIGLPPPLTAATGLDALTHCIEAYVSKAYGPIGKAIAIAGIELIFGSLTRAYDCGDDLEARTDMSMAAVMGGMAFGAGLGLGAAHALAHQLSTEYSIPHGVANALMLPAVMMFNAERDPTPFVRIAQAMNAPGDLANAPNAAAAAIEKVRELCGRLHIPSSLQAVGVSEDRIPKMATQALRDSCHRRNPRPCTETDMRMLYRAAF